MSEYGRNREKNKVLRKELRKELAAVREMTGREEKWQAEEADWMTRIKMIEEKMEQREKKERKNNVIINKKEVEEWLEREIGVKVNVKEAFEINKDKMTLAKVENYQ
jgi:hypothetical protein